jgi:hypothetical protein
MDLALTVRGSCLRFSRLAAVIELVQENLEPVRHTLPNDVIVNSLQNIA